MATRGPQMANGVWKMVYPKVFGRSRHLLPNKFFDQSIPSMRNVGDGEKQEEKKTRKEKNGEYSGPLTSLPVDRLTATDCNADRSCQKLIQRKLTGAPNNLGLESFPDPVGHFGAPWRPFWIFQVLIEGVLGSKNLFSKS